MPVFGSVYWAMKFAGMIDYTFPPGVGGNENLITDTICTVGLLVVGAIKKLLVYMEMHIQNGYFPGLLREFFAYLDQDLEQYAFYQVFRDFVTSLPGYRISEGLADFWVSMCGAVSDLLVLRWLVNICGRGVCIL